MNEISRTADEGALERCGECGEYVSVEAMLSVLHEREEIVSCLQCHLIHNRIFM